MPNQKITPGRQYYVLSGLVFVAGITAFVWLLFSTLTNLTQGLSQYVVPGEHRMNLPETGRYTIFHEYQSVVGNRIYSAAQRGLSGMQVNLYNGDSGKPVQLTPSASNSTYSMGSRSGLSVFDFELSVPGEYVLTARYGPGVKGPETVLALVHGFGRDLFNLIMGSIGLMFGTLGISAAIAVVTYIKRERASKQLQSNGSM